MVTIIEVEEEVSGGPIVVIVVVAGSAAQDDRGRRQAAVREAGVDTWEASVRREEGIQVGMRLDRGVRCGDALPRLLFHSSREQGSGSLQPTRRPMEFAPRIMIIAPVGMAGTRV